jgi:hypothetical protein
MQGRNLLAYDRIIGSFVDINLGPVSIVLRDVGVGENCFHRTLGHAGIAINTGVSINVEAVRQFVKCFNWAHRSTVCVFTINA